MTTDAKAIHAAIYDLLKPLEGPRFKKVRKVPVRQLQPEETPTLSVFRSEEDWQPDGDANAGEPSFVHESTITLAVLRGFKKPEDLDDLVDADMDIIEPLLLQNTDLLAMFEGITRVRRTLSWPQLGDAYYVESVLELTVQYRTVWEPIVPDNLLKVVTTHPAVWSGPIQVIEFEEQP